MSDIYQKLDKVRKPRIQIKYDVEVADGKVTRELPFVIGIMGDFAGNSPKKPLPAYRQREFISVDQDSLSQTMQRLSPGIAINVENRLSDNKSPLPLQLYFNSINDFSPEQIIEQVDSLKKLKLTRDKLRDLLARTDYSEELETILKNSLQDSELLKSIMSQINNTRNTFDEQQ